jgi:outer membrane protein TolC
MPSRRPRQHPLPGILAIVAIAVASSRCASTASSTRAPEARPAPVEAPVRTARDAARLALERSPRVAAARHAFEAACARRRAIEVPPDLRIELMTGIPLMEMSATPLRASLGASLAWLLNRELLATAADRQVEAAAAVLATTACEVASEAREAHRTVAARAIVVDAARTRLAELNLALGAEEAAALAGERSLGEIEALRARVAEAERSLRAADGQLEAAIAAFASLVGDGAVSAETSGSVEAILEAECPIAARLATRAEAVAAATVAERRRWLASLEPAFGSTLDGSVGFERDMEGDEMVFVGVGITIPSARLPREIEAARASLAEAEAALAEAERVAELEARSARILLDAARGALDSAQAALAALDRAVAADEAGLSIGERSRTELAGRRIARADAAEAVALAALAWSGARGRLERLHPLADGSEGAAGERTEESR